MSSQRERDQPIERTSDASDCAINDEMITSRLVIIVIISLVMLCQNVFVSKQEIFYKFNSKIQITTV